ncbi:MAG: DUF4118 domain-containing protein [Bacilli bacterium]|nr:DUF4118 domain-containing protein [Bacilli bacterium]
MYRKNIVVDSLKSIFILIITFLICLLLQQFYSSQSLVEVIFLLAVFLIALNTEGYTFGIIASLSTVLINNFVFTFPYFKFDFITPENLLAAIVTLIVAVMTCSLTTKIKVQEKLKAENEKEKTKANLLRAISHDLRTPLTTIYGSCSAIIENYDSLTKEQQLKLLKEVQEDSESLIRMVENLLSVTRVSSESVRVNKTYTVLEELIDTTLVKFHKSYPQQNIKVSIPEEFVSIPIDALLIQQVLINLLENAVIHAKGMTELSLTVELDDNKAIFKVGDNGCGIPKEKVKHLFNGYIENKSIPADGSRNNMGIGLSVCSTIIKAHGGDITVKNNNGVGTVFIFSLNMEDDDNEQ